MKKFMEKLVVKYSSRICGADVYNSSVYFCRRDCAYFIIPGVTSGDDDSSYKVRTKIKTAFLLSEF